MIDEAIAIRLNEISKSMEGAELFQIKVTEQLNAITEILGIIAEAINAETIQKVISPEEVEDYLRNGWKYADSFSNGRETFIVVEINEKERR